MNKYLLFSAFFLYLSSFPTIADQLSIDPIIESEYRQLSDRIYQEMTAGNHGYLKIYHPILSWGLENKNALTREIDEMRLELEEQLSQEVSTEKKRHLASIYKHYHFKKICGFQLQDNTFILEQWNFTIEYPNLIENETKEMLYVKKDNYWFVGENNEATNGHYSRMAVKTKPKEISQSEIEIKNTLMDNECFKKLNI